jgi:hypothetical protein
MRKGSDPFGAILATHGRGIDFDVRFDSQEARNDMTRRSGGALARCALAGAALLTGVLMAPPVRALEEQKGEQQALDACDERLCRMLQQKTPAGEDLKCRLTKTWARSTIKEADRTELSWGFGDARCSVELNVSRAAIVAAVTSTSPFKFWLPPHTADCVIEQDGQLKPIKATVAPKIVFKDGRAEKVWINLTHIDGPANITGWLSAGAQLSDRVGIFHRAMVKSVNGYIYKHCPKYYPLAQAGKSPPKPR